MSFHVLRKDREITNPEAMRKVLKSAKYVTVALCMDNQPYLVALSHGFDEQRNCLYFHCASRGKKLTYAKSNNNVWGQAVQDYGVVEECDYAYTSVHFQGKLFIVEDPEEKRHAMEVMVRQVSPNPEAKLAKLKPEKIATTTMGRIDIEAITGKQHLNSKVK
jgi:nitroimidazol reductase NimA-like FMN-containing flavoprotein (pyridoxamine 5'-phosphate oxidase superfamily)